LCNKCNPKSETKVMRANLGMWRRWW
jgi:hypothetical protein